MAILKDEKINFPDCIAKLCYDQYEKLPKTGKPRANNEWTLMAAVVMENESAENKGGKSSPLDVVSMATGTKCIGYGKMSPKGAVLNDSHAEVLARRAFIRFLYEQLNLALDPNASSIFDFQASEGLFHLHEGIKFHLFSSGVPCGDAAIFPQWRPSGEASEGRRPSKRHKGNGGPISGPPQDPDPPSVVAADVHRTGAKCIEGAGIHERVLPGTDYHVTGILRTKPGRGDRTLSMSCSDKMAKWNVLGVQGSLLDQFIYLPIYLVSITIGKGPYDSAAMHRAVIGRNQKLPDLPEPYRVATPSIFQSSLLFVHSEEAVGRHNPRIVPSSAGVIWSKVSSRTLEVVVNGYRQGVTAKNLSSDKARCAVCKYELFKMYEYLLRRMQYSAHLPRQHVPRKYGACKRLSATHANARDLFLATHTDWTQKPEKLTEFELESRIEDAAPP